MVKFLVVIIHMSTKIGDINAAVWLSNTHYFQWYNLAGNGYMSMAYCKKDVTPLLTQWSYVFLALTIDVYLSTPCDWDRGVWNTQVYFFISNVFNIWSWYVKIAHVNNIPAISVSRWYMTTAITLHYECTITLNYRWLSFCSFLNCLIYSNYDENLESSCSDGGVLTVSYKSDKKFVG